MPSTPDVSIIVPLRPDGAERDRNWRYLRARYQRLYPDWEIIEHPGTATGAWSKGAAVNAAVQQAAGETLIVADADLIVAADVLPRAVAQLQHSAWVIPHGLVYRLNEKITAELISTQPDPYPVRVHTRDLRRAPHLGPAGGGLVVTRRDDFEKVGGIDPRFTDWGGEDISLARALDTLVGRHTRLGALSWHLDHAPMPRRPGGRGSTENEQLAGLYLDANGNRQAMAELCEQRPYRGVAGGGIVVLSRDTLADVPLDPRFCGWGDEDLSWGYALDTLKGPPWRGSAPLLHLWHPPQPRIHQGMGSRANARLRTRYKLAQTSIPRMRALLEEASHGTA